MNVWLDNVHSHARCSALRRMFHEDAWLIIGWNRLCWKNWWYRFLTFMWSCSAPQPNPFCFILLLKIPNTSVFLCTFSNRWAMLSSAIKVGNEALYMLSDGIHTSDDSLQNILASDLRPHLSSGPESDCLVRIRGSAFTPTQTNCGTGVNAPGFSLN